MTKDIKVSVICATYNQENYISEAINSFLKQKTTFDFEIIVHDDASTDNTSKILRQFQSEYPDKVFPIIQDENQYSKGIKISTIMANVAKGEYLAWCEGDDFWIDDNKLQLQVDAIENHSANICFHSCYTQLPNKKRKLSCRVASCNSLIGFSDVLRGGGGFIPTASILLRKSTFLSFPSWFQDAPVGDYYIQMLGAIENGAIYLDKPMSVYRLDVPNSWSVSASSNASENKLKNHLESHIKCMKKVNELIPENLEEDYHYAIARTYMYTGELALNRGLYALFRETVELSWEIKSHISTKQRIYYTIRRFKRITTLFHYIKSKITRLR